MLLLSTFSKLQTPVDLLRKAFHDLLRMADHMDDEYAAFDFFVTTEHRVDWHLPGDSAAQRDLRNDNVLLQITSHVANGAKHFRATSKHHKSVQHIWRKNFDEVGYEETGYVGEVLFVDISPEEAKVLGTNNIEAYQLALRVYASWRERLAV